MNLSKDCIDRNRNSHIQKVIPVVSRKESFSQNLELRTGSSQESFTNDTGNKRISPSIDQQLLLTHWRMKFPATDQLAVAWPLGEPTKVHRLIGSGPCTLLRQQSPSIECAVMASLWLAILPSELCWSCQVSNMSVTYAARDGMTPFMIAQLQMPSRPGEVSTISLLPVPGCSALNPSQSET